MRFILFILVCLCVPQAAFGAIVISEIAWMGTVISANDEWIELHNTSNTRVDLDGWKLVDGMNLEIVLSGSLDAGAYGVLERTDDDTAPGSALLIYTGALANSGATLKLLRQDGSLEDQVAGGENWSELGGDNATKETAQYSEKGWITAPGTPGKNNAETQTDTDTQEEDTDTPASSTLTTKSSGKKNDFIELKVPDTELSLVLHGPERVFVNQEVKYTVEGFGIGETLLRSLRYYWSFGDLESATGTSVVHRFPYAGEYVVSVEGNFGRYTQVARKNVTVLPVSFMLSHNSSGELILHNNAKYEVDISGYTVGGIHSRTFPKNTLMRPGGTITFTPNVMHTFGGGVPTLRDQKRRIVARLGEPLELTKEVTVPTLTKDVPVSPAPVGRTPDPLPVVSSRNLKVLDDVVVDRKSTSGPPLVLSLEQLAGGGESVIPQDTSLEVRTASSYAYLPYGLLAAVLVGGVGAIVYGGRRSDF